MAERGGNTIAAILGAAGAGFRLSLLLNAVAVGMSTEDLEIQTIAKEISLFSLTLKQVGLLMESPDSIASQSAIDTAGKFSSQSRMIFTEIKEMEEVSQTRDEQGHLRSVTVARRVRWCSKKHKVQYLLAQLESLKLSLSIMLQVFQLGKYIAETCQPSPRPAPKQQDMLQERAEIQNMVVVRDWSLVKLERLYKLAEDEASQPEESPPPSADGIAEMDGDPRLTITASAHEDSSKAMVRYHETPLAQLGESMNKVMSRPNKILRALDNNVVDYLLKEWTKLSGAPSRPRHPQHRHSAHYETDTESDSEYDFERSQDTGGRFLEGSKNSTRKTKNVHFQARVESESENSDFSKPRRKPPKKSVLRSDDEDSTTTVSSSDEFSSPSNSRRSSASSSTNRGPETLGVSPNSHRFIPPGSPNPNNNREIQPGRPASRGEAQPGRPASRGGPPSPKQSRPAPILSQPWQGQPSPWQPHHQPRQPPPPGQFPNLRPPPLHNPPHRTPSTNQYFPRPPAYPHGRPSYPAFPTLNSHRSASQRERSGPRKEKRSEKREKQPDKRESGFNVTKGLIGAGAVAGLMDILQGLSAF